MIKHQLFIMFLFCSGNMLAQNYQPMLGDSNIWYILHTFEGSSTYTRCARGDTMIKGKSYKILGFCDKNNNNEFTYFRDDTIDKKVYAIPPRSIDTTEVIYCDFNLNANDSIYLYDVKYYGDSIGWFYVDSVYIYNSPLGPKKAIAFSGVDTNGYPYFPVWIEGIGPIGDPINPYSTPDNWGPGQLNCFYRDSVKVFQSDVSISYGTCEIFTGIEEFTKEDQVLFFPNPTSGITEIITSIHSDYVVTVFTITGHQLWQSYNSTSVDMTSFESGLYLIQIRTGNKVYSKKIILNRYLRSLEN